MLLSMTGFGAGRKRVGEEEISVEIRSVNHKFCEVKPRLPTDLAALEIELVKQIKETVRRGSVDVFVKRSGSGQSTVVPRLDLDLAQQYVELIKAAAGQLGLIQNLGAAELAQVEGLITLESRGIDLDSARQALQQATAEALLALKAMRQREGETLAHDFLARIGTLRQHAHQVYTLSPATVEHYRARLADRVAELARGVAVDPGRLAQEVALFADRVDITEEQTRLLSHLEGFEKLVNSDEPAGRRMDFLVQELNREVNTMGSKSQSAQIAQLIVAMKAEIERIREQVQNIE